MFKSLQNFLASVVIMKPFLTCQVLLKLKIFVKFATCTLTECFKHPAYYYSGYTPHEKIIGMVCDFPCEIMEKCC